MKNIKILTLIITTFILSSIGIFLTSCNNNGISFQSFFSQSSGGNNQPSNPYWARLIDTNNAIDLYRGAIFDGNNYYIAGWQRDSTRKLALISLNLDGNLNLAKYWTVNGYTDVGLRDIFIFDNDNLLVSGWLTFLNVGFVGNYNKNTNNLVIKKVFNIPDLSSICDNNFIYLASANNEILSDGIGGYVLKLNKNDFSIVSTKQVVQSGNFDFSFENITLQAKINPDYIGLEDLHINRVVVLNSSDLSLVKAYDTNISQNPLIDENGNLYLFDKVNNNLVVSKIDLATNNVISKQYGTVIYYSSSAFIFNSTGQTTHLVVGYTIDNRINNQGQDVEFLKLDKNLNVIWSVIVGTTSDDEIALRTMFGMPDGGLFAARRINWSDYGYAVRLGPNGELPTSCLFHHSSRNTQATNISYNPTDITANVSVNDVTITELPIPQIQEVQVQTDVLDLCVSQSNGGGYFNITPNNNTHNNVDDNLNHSGSGARR